MLRFLERLGLVKIRLDIRDFVKRSKAELIRLGREDLAKLYNYPTLKFKWFWQKD